MNKASLATLLIFIFTAINGASPAVKDQDLPDQGQVQDSQDYRLRVPVDVVIVRATATDKKGIPIKDLSANDFVIYEDGKRQAIQTFDLESYRHSSQTLEQQEGLGPHNQEIERRSRGKLPKRMVTLIVDDLTTSEPQDALRAIEYIQKYIQQSEDPADQISVGLASGRFHSAFIQDQAQLLSAIDQLRKNLSINHRFVSDCPFLSDYAAQRVHDREEDRAMWQLLMRDAATCSGNVPAVALEQEIRVAASQQHSESRQSNQQLIASLRQYIASQPHSDSRKIVVLLSPGFYTRDLLSELEAIVDTALHTGTVFHTIDNRGLYTTNFQASEAISSPSAEVISHRISERTSDMRMKQEPLAVLAEETGGLFFHDNNDILAGLRKVVDSHSFYYVLSYRSPAHELDGRFHKIKLEVSRPGLKLNYRKGYYARKEEVGPRPEIKLEVLEAIEASVGQDEIPMEVSYDTVQLEAAKYELSLIAKAGLIGIPVQSENGQRKNLIRLYVVVYDQNDQYLDGLEKQVEMNLSDPSYQALLRYGFSSKAKFLVPPGQYNIKVAIREDIHQKAGFVERTIQVP